MIGKKRSVKPSAQPTQVRTLHLPPRKFPGQARCALSRRAVLRHMGRSGSVGARSGVFPGQGLPLRRAVPGGGPLRLRSDLIPSPHGRGTGEIRGPPAVAGRLPRWAGCSDAGRHLAGMPQCGAGGGFRTATSARPTVRERADRRLGASSCGADATRPKRTDDPVRSAVACHEHGTTLRVFLPPAAGIAPPGWCHGAGDPDGPDRLRAGCWGSPG
jgi:hypothetical protein